MDKQPTCLRCGLCCHYIKDGKLTSCKYLVKISNGKTYCKVYKNRLNRKIDDEGFYCTFRVFSPIDYPGCPYNKGKPMTEEHLKLYEQGKNE